MSQNTFPQFTNMMPVAEDIQLIVDSLRTEDRNRITKDGIFEPGIVNEKSDYLSAGTNPNSIKIKPFIAYAISGDRIEVGSTWDNLFPQGSVIPVSNENLADNYTNIPVWHTYTKNYTNLDEASLTQTLKITDLGKGSILHGIKLRTNELFNIQATSTQPNITVSIGTTTEPDKFLPETSVSESNLSTNLSVMNLMYSIDDATTTEIVITFKSDSANLNTLVSGSITINLCIADLSTFDNSSLDLTDGGFEMNNNITGSWQPSTTYHIVARYVENLDKYVSLNYIDNNGNAISTTAEPTRVITNYKFYALRKSGSATDATTSKDVKLGEVVTDSSGNIISINVNGTNPITGNAYTQYLTLPGYRFVNNIDAAQIADGSVSNTKFQYLNTLTSNVQTQLNNKASLTQDNTFTGNNTFTEQINGDIKTVNGFSAFSTPTSNSLLVLDENGKIPADALSESTISSIGNFYTVSSGVTTNGRSSFLVANSEENGVVLQASADNPLVLNYPDGSVEKFYENQEIEGLSADGYYYLVKEKDGNFNFLPTNGGTEATIPVVGSGNQFVYHSSTGTVKSFFENATAYKAFDGTITDGTLMGSVTYKNFAHIETVGYLPSTDPTYLEITYPEAVQPTGFSACFRTSQYDATPKSWTFEGSNDDGTTWTQIISGSNSTWNVDEIKYIDTNNAGSFKKFRFTFNVNSSTINNYMVGEQTPSTGVTMPIMCYYFQIYAVNTDTTNKGNIVEGYKLPTGMNIGSYFLDISKKPYTGYKVIGSNQTAEVNFVKLGFINLTGYGTDNVILTCYPFCYNTFTISDVIEVSKNYPISFDHNLGVIPNVVSARFVCLNDNNGYSAGDIITEMYAGTPIQYSATTLGYSFTSIKDAFDLTVTNITLNPGNATDNLFIKHKSTKSLVQATNGDWGIVLYCSRGW